MATDLVLQERLSDVILKVRQSEQLSWRIPAHSLLLASKSSIFQELLEERHGDERPTPLSIVGIQPETAVAVLKYIYENKFPPIVTADLLIASKKYGLEPLRDNLEERLMEDLTIPQVCDILEELNVRNPVDDECMIKAACYSILEMHALTVFGSDLIMRLGKITLCRLLASDVLNVPDDAYLFWGIWRWARRQSSMNNRSLKDEDVASYIDDLIVCIRRSSLKNRAGIPRVASTRFNACKCRRSLYTCPPDILKHSSSIRPCSAWEDIIEAKLTQPEESPYCIQFSVENDVMLVGLSLEMNGVEGNQISRSDSIVRIFQENDRKEVFRQKIGWSVTSVRRLTVKGEAEHRMESEVLLHTPLFLTPGNMYSIRLLGNFSSCHFFWGSFKKMRTRAGNTFVNFHGEGVSTVRELYVIPDISVTWGPRIVED